MRRSYAVYRDAAVDWVGRIPEHWQERRLKSTVERSDIRVEPEVPNDAPYVGLEHVKSGTGHLLPLDEEQEQMGLSNAFACGDVLFGKLRPYLAKAFCAEFDGLCSTEFLVLRPVRYERRYLLHLLLTDGFVSYADSSTFGARMPRTDWDFIGGAVLPAPPHAEQVRIANFLDFVTARIDRLISMQESLIKRLDEYRTALITRVVTTGLPPEAAEAAGLDPSPCFEDSGVGWLGEVPKHWEVARNRRIFAERDDRSENGEGELLTVSHITGVGRRSDRPDVGMFMAETLEGYKRCEPGDLVVNTMWAWMGASGTAAEAGLVSPSYNVYSPDRTRLIPRFVDMAYRSGRYVAGMTSESRGIWTSRLRLYPQQFLSLVTAVPPMAEQEAIVSHVDAAEDRAKRMARAISKSIERLSEYRSAVISAAVTGKIDVRDEALVGGEGGA